MRQLLTIVALTLFLAQVSRAQLTINWLSQGANLNGQPADSRFPSISADGMETVFQVGNGTAAQIWLATSTNQWQPDFVRVPGTNEPLLGVHPVISADGKHIAFASWQDYSLQNPAPLSKSQIYVLDRLQNRIVPISFLWQDTNGDSVRDDGFVPSNGNCLPVAISSDGRIVVFIAQSPDALNIVDEEGDGVADAIPNPPQGWLVLVHDRDADGNGVYDEMGIGATRTFIGSLDTNGEPLLAVSVSVTSNGRIIAFASPDPNDPEIWHIFVRDWQSGTGDFIRDANNNPVIAFAPTLSDDGAYLAYLAPKQLDNDGDGQVNEDPVDSTDNDNDGAVDEDPIDLYPQTPMDLIVRQLIDPATGQTPTQIRELRLSGLQLPSQGGTADGSAGWGYEDWWGAVTLSVDPTNPNIVYTAFHAWATDLIDLQLVRNDLFVDGAVSQTDRLGFYQGVLNVFLARFNFANYDANPQAPNRIQLWRMTEWTDQQQPSKLRGFPVSLETVAGQQPQYRLALAPNLMPAVSFVNGTQFYVVFQSLAPLISNDANGLWDIYLATVTLPQP